MNLCFKNLGIMNLCTSARESWITRLWEKLNKIHVWINCVRSRECRIWRLRESSFQKFFRGTCPRTPLYNSCIRGWQSACFSNCSVTKTSMPRQNEWWYQVWMKQKFEHQRIQNETKLPLRKRQWHIQGRGPGGPPYFSTKMRLEGPKKIFWRPHPPPPISGSGWPDSPLIFKGLDRPPIGDQKSSWITNLEENSLWISWHYIVLFNNRNTRIIVSCLLSLVQMRTVKRPWWGRMCTNMWLSHVNGGWYTVHTVVFHSLNTTKR